MSKQEKYIEIFNSFDEVIKAFNLSHEEWSNVHFIFGARIPTFLDSGECVVIFERDGALYQVLAEYNPSMRLEEEWEPEEVTIQDLVASHCSDAIMLHVILEAIKAHEKMYGMIKKKKKLVQPLDVNYAKKALYCWDCEVEIESGETVCFIFDFEKSVGLVSHSKCDVPCVKDRYPQAMPTDEGIHILHVEVTIWDKLQ